MRYVNDVVSALIETGSHRATKYVSATHVIKATRRAYKRKNKYTFGKGSIDIVLTIGRPNYSERRFIAECRSAGKRLPVRQVQLKALPKVR